jgi:hypothetical protein
LSRTDDTRLLRWALKLDAVATAANGLADLALGGLVGSALGFPASLLWTVGAVLTVYGATVWFLATRPVINRAGAWAVLVLNLLWVVDSIALLATGWYPVTALGEVLVVGQALAVGVFATLQYLGLRRSA